MTPTLQALVTGDDPDAWTAAGFAVEQGALEVGGVGIVCTGDGRGHNRWTLGPDVPSTDLDGIPSVAIDPAAPAGTGHPNGISAVDHVVVRSPDLDRTTGALGAAGFDCRRIRDVPGGGGTQQRFFLVGPRCSSWSGRPNRPATVRPRSGATPSSPTTSTPPPGTSASAWAR